MRYFWLLLVPGMVFGSVARQRMEKAKNDAAAKRKASEWQAGEVRRRAERIKRKSEERRRVANERRGAKVKRKS